MVPWLSRSPRSVPGPPILFIHVPKTAGTSLRQMLQAAHGRNVVYPSDRDIVRRHGGLYPTAADILRDYASLRPYHVLIGHFGAGLADTLPVPHRTAVMLRDPVQRSLSMLAHMHRHRGIPPETVMASESWRAEYIADYQTRLLGDTAWGARAGGRPALLDKALRTVDTFDFVGITERFAESCRMFDARFGTSVGRRIRRSNVLRPRGRGYEAFIPDIEPLVARDRVLYEHAVARFEGQLGAARTATAELRRAA